MIPLYSCDVCGSTDAAVHCPRCRAAHYCGREHQVTACRNHRKRCCKKFDLTTSFRRGQFRKTQNTTEYLEEVVFSDGPAVSSVHESENYRAVTTIPENIPDSNSKDDGKIDEGIDVFCRKHIAPDGEVPPPTSYDKGADDPCYDLIANLCYEALKEKGENDVLDEICRNVVRDMDLYGVCVVDKFMGRQRGIKVLQEVKTLRSRGVFQDGQLVSYKKHYDAKSVRSDRIAWLDGTRSDCPNIDGLIERVDKIVVQANRSGKGEMGRIKIGGRTKAMVACYPAAGSHYVKHVDNPNKDGRRVTAIYYLNLDWDADKDGGLLRIFPAGWNDTVADIEPVFDRLLFFWSDRRNPHEVQPAFKTRFAITLWYFDSDERKTAICQNKIISPSEETVKLKSCSEQQFYF